MDSIKRMSGAFGILLMIVAVLLLIPTYLVSTTDLQKNITYDGWGRMQFPTPALLTEITGGAWKHWAGGFWFVIDTLIFWILAGTGFNFYNKILKGVHRNDDYELYQSDYWRHGR